MHRCSTTKRASPGTSAERSKRPRRFTSVIGREGFCCWLLGALWWQSGEGLTRLLFASEWTQFWFWAVHSRWVSLGFVDAGNDLSPWRSSTIR